MFEGEVRLRYLYLGIDQEFGSVIQWRNRNIHTSFSPIDHVEMFSFQNRRFKINNSDLIGISE